MPDYDTLRCFEHGVVLFVPASALSFDALEIFFELGVRGVVATPKIFHDDLFLVVGNAKAQVFVLFFHFELQILFDDVVGDSNARGHLAFFPRYTKEEPQKGLFLFRLF